MNRTEERIRALLAVVHLSPLAGDWELLKLVAAIGAFEEREACREELAKVRDIVRTNLNSDYANSVAQTTLDILDDALITRGM